MATKTPVKKKNPSQTKGQEDPEQKEFVMWLQKKFQLQDEQALQQKIQELGEEGLKQAYAAFKQEKQQATSSMMKLGGRVNHVNKLYELKCGSKMKKKKKEDGGKLKPYSKPTAKTADLNKKCC